MSQVRSQESIFYENVRKTLILGKIMGFLPIEGLFNKNSDMTRGTWRSPYTFYYIFNTTLRVSVLCLLIADATLSSCQKFNYHGKLEVLITFCSLFLTIYLSIYCKNWKNMMTKIKKIERLLPRSTRPKTIHVDRVIFFMFFIGTFEHMVFLIFTVRILCNSQNEICSVQRYYELYYDFVFNFMPFTYFAAFLVQLCKFQRTFLFIFLDPMIVSVTLYLMNRFQDFNYTLTARLKGCNRNTQWAHIQAHYTRLTELVKVIDDKYNTIIFTYFSINLLFVCKNIYVLVQHQRQRFENIGLGFAIIQSSDWVLIFYFFTNNATLLIRVLIIATTTAYLHTITREPLNALHTIPASAYNPQFQRFMDQVYQSRIHLTGLKMFNISRSTILSVLSTIITYELVLVQLPDYEQK